MYVYKFANSEAIHRRTAPAAALLVMVSLPARAQDPVPLPGVNVIGTAEGRHVQHPRLWHREVQLQNRTRIRPAVYVWGR